ncbi:hypothetical protein [Candidatus Protochlamydia sp. W-9]|uniref:hypothetical protein n=1 Tax=Candidatus Protochlamydia sp. W-9 TaxID=1785087 RepID=UPI00096A4F19|nr:hypothetical protein [Candidatus Protochlamydia sp. W-9]
MSDRSVPNFISIVKKIPSRVICLIFTLAFHEMATPIFHSVYIVLPHYVHKSAISYPIHALFGIREEANKDKAGLRFFK